MSSSMLNLQLLLKAVDEISDPVKRINGNLRGLEDQVKKTATAGERLQALGKNISAAGLAVAGASAGAAAALGMEKLPFEAARAEHSLRALGNIAGLTGDQIKHVQAAVLGMTTETNQAQEELIGGLSTLLSKGMDLGDGLTILPSIGKAATAAQASIEDLSRSVYAGIDNLKIPAKEATAYLDILAQSGKEGSFELKDMARHFPSLTARAQALGMAGKQSAAQLGAALQIAMKGAGSPDEAANNFLNFLSKLTAPETVRNFSKMGINLQEEMKKGWASGDLPAYMTELIQRATKGDQFKMGELFGDMQVLGFLKPMIANLEEYKRIKDKSLGASGVVDKDFQNMLTTTTEKWKKLKLQVATIILPKITPWLERISGWLDKLSKDPAKVQRLVNGIMGGILGGLALVGLGQAIRLIGTITNGYQALATHGPKAWALISAGIKSASINARYYGEYTKLMGGPLRGGLEMAKDSGGLLGKLAGKAQGFSLKGAMGSVSKVASGGGIKSALSFSWLMPLLKGVGAAIMGISWPVVAVVAVIVAAAALIWKYWKPISNFFAGMGAGIASAFEPVMPPLRAMCAWFKKLLTPVESTGKSFEYGAKVGKAIGWVLMALVKVVMVTVRVVSGLVQGWWAFIKMGWTLLKWWVMLPGEFLKKVLEFRKAGMSIPKAIWEGIKAMASKPIEAIKEMIGKIKSLLGFGKSEGITAEVKATSQVVQGVVPSASTKAAPVLPAGDSLPALESGIGSSPAAASGGGGMQITFSPSIQIGTAVPGVEELVMSALRNRLPELEAMIQKMQGRQAARAY